jgi:hypothetical protein
MLLLVVAAISFSQQNVSAPQKFALVIGNGNYTGMTPLKNPVNDANDIEAALKGLGFTVDKVLNGNLNQIENAIIRLKNRLSVSKNSYGFFFYAGHGVQSGGINYLIPVGASIPSENFLRDRAVSVQAMLGELNDAGNDLNVIVLDACRDNPFGWARSGSRGLTVVSNQPADSIIVYATSAGSTASDGTDRNGLFTSHLLTQLKTPGLTVREVFDRTGSAVARASERKQVPAIYSQYFETAYLGSRPAAIQPSSASQQAPVFEQGSVSIATGSLEISTVTAGTLQITGGALNQRSELPAWGTLPIAKINAGSYRVSIRYGDGKTEEKTVEVGRNESKKLEFTYKPAPAAQPAPAPAASTGQTYKIGDKGPAGGIIFYDKGNNSNGWRYLEASPVNLGNAQWGLYKVNVSGTKTGIGEGKRNTELIIAEINKRGETGKAAQLCMAYSLNGYNDWFLPSRDELAELYKQRGCLGIKSRDFFWSSSQNSNDSARYQDFGNGVQSYTSKYDNGNVRAVRAF